MGAMNCQRFMILSRQHLVVLGHQEYPEVKNRQSVNTLQLPPAEDGVWLL